MRNYFQMTIVMKSQNVGKKCVSLEKGAYIFSGRDIAGIITKKV